MEDDPTELFAGDAGTLDADVRRVLVQLLRRRFLLAEKSPRAVAYVAGEPADDRVAAARPVHPARRRPRPGHRLQAAGALGGAGRADPAQGRPLHPGRDAGAGPPAHRLPAGTRRGGDVRAGGHRGAGADRADLLRLADDHNLAARPAEIRTRSASGWSPRGCIEEESEGRYRITPLVEIVLSTEKLASSGVAEQSAVEPQSQRERGDRAVNMIDTLFGLIPAASTRPAVGRARPAAGQLGRLRRRTTRCGSRPTATLLSGGSGSGKSTLMDAYIALLMPHTTPFNGASNGGVVGPAARQGPAQHPLLRARQDRRVADRRRDQDRGCCAATAATPGRRSR